MIRLHFSATDLRRITLAPRPEALFETALSVRLLLGTPNRPPGSDAARARWRRAMNGTPADLAGILPDLVRQTPYLPDFLLQPALPTFDDAVQSARSTPAAQLHQDLAPLIEPPRTPHVPPHIAPPAPARLRALADGDLPARDAFAADLHRYHASAIASLWPQITATATADRALRAEMLLRGGVDALLTTLNPTWRWQPPTLHLPSARDTDIPLCGRGLLLLPSYFTVTPLVRYHPDEATVLLYPMHHPTEPASAPHEALTSLLGRTRAAVLAGLRSPATTTALAERTNISLAGASQHATVLRHAGLITTQRTGTTVLHTLTPLGHALLDGTR